MQGATEKRACPTGQAQGGRWGLVILCLWGWEEKWETLMFRLNIFLWADIILKNGENVEWPESNQQRKPELHRNSACAVRRRIQKIRLVHWTSLILQEAAWFDLESIQNKKSRPSKMIWIFGPSDWSRTSGLLNPIGAKPNSVALCAPENSWFSAV